MASPTRAIGFVLGETLLTYADLPLSWASLYPTALAAVANRIGSKPSAAQRAAAARVLSRYNTRLHPRSAEISASVIFENVFAAWSLAADSLEPAMAAFFDFFQQRLRPYAESACVLDELRARGFRIGVLTDVPYGMPRQRVERDLAETNLSTRVDALLTSVDIGWRKPEPAGFRALAAKLGVEPSDLWFVGNEEKDITGARAAQAKAVLIDRENRPPRLGSNAHRARFTRRVVAGVSNATQTPRRSGVGGRRLELLSPGAFSKTQGMFLALLIESVFIRSERSEVSSWRSYRSPVRESDWTLHCVQNANPGGGQAGPHLTARR